MPIDGGPIDRLMESMLSICRIMSYQTTPEPEEPIQQRSLLEAIEGDNDDDVDKYSFENGQLTINAILTQVQTYIPN